MKVKLDNKVLNQTIMDSMPGLAYIFSKDGHWLPGIKEQKKFLVIR